MQRDGKLKKERTNTVRLHHGQSTNEIYWQKLKKIIYVRGRKKKKKKFLLLIPWIIHWRTIALSCPQFCRSAIHCSQFTMYNNSLLPYYSYWYRDHVVLIRLPSSYSSFLWKNFFLYMLQKSSKLIQEIVWQCNKFVSSAFYLFPLRIFCAFYYQK